MDLSVVIVNWNSGSYLARLVASLKPFEHEVNEVIVVDNASEDSSLELIASNSKIQTVLLKDNHGFAHGANEGISRATAEFILLLNPDIELKQQSVQHLYRKIVALPGAAILCGPLLDAQGNLQQQFQPKLLPTWRSVLRDVLFIDELLKPRVVGGRRSVVSGSEVEQPPAAFWLLRKQAWQSIGGFDTVFHPAWFEDVDFCKRVRAAGWSIFYFADAPSHHTGGLAFKRLGYSTFVEIYFGNLLKYLKKHHQYSYPFLWLPVQFGILMRKRFIRR